MEEIEDYGSVRQWCFTVNNYSDDDVVFFKTLTPRYLVFGLEICPKTGTPHLQGYVVFKDKKSMSAVKKYFKCNKMHLKPRYKHSSFTSASEYCKKDGIFFEYGQPIAQGKRTDLDNVMNIVRETHSMREVVEVATSYQSVRMAEVWLKYNDKPRNRKQPVYVWWFYGRSGTGKTTAAYDFLEKYGRVYTAGDTGKWFDGYDGEECVIFDELRSDSFSFKMLLALLHPNPVRVECKGGSRQFRGRYIVITTPYPPEKFVPLGEEVYQLERRIFQQIKFEMLSQNLVIKNPLQEGYSPSDEVPREILKT